MPTALITGTSTGFGRVTTEVLAARGWRVFATMRDLKRKDPLERALRNAGLSDRVTFVQLDVTDPASIEAAITTVLSKTGNALDAVVHNAGVAVAGVLEDLPDADIQCVMETNLFGVLKLTRALLPIFRAQRGRIVLLSSQAALAGQPGNSMYCASKWALEGWAESLAYEVDPFGIDVVLIEPGPYRTEIWNNTKWVVPASSAYLSWLKLLRHAADRHQAKTSRDPKEVALVVAKALEARRPRFRYQVGPFAKLDYFLRRKMPTKLIRRGTTRYLGLPLARW
ncbi:SDR family oxidoreductase [Methyloceanibacter sp.]|uniref:SDR family oxidoreductase n=1 Tax=Methyloceanibacter sp. TaxID=1965321 RepID=UPI003C715C28